ncbi:MAG: hypothetical protein RLZZ589_1089, partial [Cyanobacteriota bacterium]
GPEEWANEPHHPARKGSEHYATERCVGQ